MIFLSTKKKFEFILIDFIQTSIMAAIFYVIIERPFNNLTTMIVFNVCLIDFKKKIDFSLIENFCFSF